MVLTAILFLLCAAISTIAGASLIHDARNALRRRREVPRVGDAQRPVPPVRV